jgi:ABC-2 type transport system ATP-binding protein
VQTLPGRELVHAILGHLHGSEVGRVSSREPTLEDAYVALVSEPEHEGTPDRTPEPAAA